MGIGGESNLHVWTGTTDLDRIAFAMQNSVTGEANLDPALVLGAAIAHEIAHLLLPDRAHADAGRSALQ